MNELEKARAGIDAADAAIAAAFEARMRAVKTVAACKRAHGLPVFDAAREQTVIEQNAARVSSELRPYYTDVLRNMMDVSKQYQRRLAAPDARELTVRTREGQYAVRVERGALQSVGEFFDLDRRVLIVTDSGVPSSYPAAVAKRCREAEVVTLPAGEASKNLDNFALLLSRMLQSGFTRRDCVVAVGGGAVGDLAGFAASAYMRGVDFYNVPTTLLAQADASIGGKTGVDFAGVKNAVGAFYPPKAVLIDPDVLATLSPRLMAEGAAEIVKIALTFDAALFEKLENGGLQQDLEGVLTRALALKRDVVEQDEREANLRRVLNFGHTLGHGIESAAAGKLLHGECVALGMLPLCAPAVRARLAALLKAYGLPTVRQGDVEAALAAVRHDKKSEGDEIRVIYVPSPGTYEERMMGERELRAALLTLGEEA